MVIDPFAQMATSRSATAATIPPSSGFGQPVTSNGFGSPSGGFSQPVSSGYGQPAAAQNPFGSNPFGAPQTMGSSFGAPQTTGGSFGQRSATGSFSGSPDPFGDHGPAYGEVMVPDNKVAQKKPEHSIVNLDNLGSKQV